VVAGAVVSTVSASVAVAGALTTLVATAVLTRLELAAVTTAVVTLVVAYLAIACWAATVGMARSVSLATLTVAGTIPEPGHQILLLWTR
jgi:hypothetical protein